MALLFLFSVFVVQIILSSAGNPSVNPFAGRSFFVNPSYQRSLQTSIDTADGDVKSNLQKMYNAPSAYWIDTMAKASGTGEDSVFGILSVANKQNPKPLVVFIVYDLPNRDCNAKASNGEVCCQTNSDGTCNYQASECSTGLNTYKTKYIDVLVSQFKKFPSIPIVGIVEPDSLPNLVTNQGNPSCSAGGTTQAYKEGIPYAVNQLSALPNVDLYLDAGHGGWLGWQNNAQGFATMVKGLGILPKLRGLSTNVANYQPIGIQCPKVGHCINGQNSGDPCCKDPCRVIPEWNYGHNELNYVALLKQTFGTDLHFVIDTGRNGVTDMRQKCANWCNIRGAGVGLIPTLKTGDPSVDAYYWLKTPGESDGCTETLPSQAKCNRFDSMCASSDSLGSASGEPRAPQAGGWFDYQVKQLAKNAVLGNDIPPSAPPSSNPPPSNPPPSNPPPFDPPPFDPPPFDPPPFDPPPFDPPPFDPPPSDPPPSNPPPSNPPPSNPPPSIPSPSNPPPRPSPSNPPPSSGNVKYGTKNPHAWWVSVKGPSSSTQVSIKCASHSTLRPCEYTSGLGGFSCPLSFGGKSCELPHVAIVNGVQYKLDSKVIANAGESNEVTETDNEVDSDSDANSDSNSTPGWATALLVVGCISLLALIVVAFVVARSRTSDKF